MVGKVKLTKAQKVAYDNLLKYGVIKYRKFSHQAGSGGQSISYEFPNGQTVHWRVMESLIDKKIIKKINGKSETGYGWKERTADYVLR